MSWQAYIDTSLVGSGSITSAAIYGLDGTLWASTPDLASANNFAQELITGFSDPVKIRSDGVTINGIRYVVIKSDERSIYGKSREKGGFVSARSKQALIVGLHGADLHLAGEAAKVVESLADYLISVNM